MKAIARAKVLAMKSRLGQGRVQGSTVTLRLNLPMGRTPQDSRLMVALSSSGRRLLALRTPAGA